MNTLNITPSAPATSPQAGASLRQTLREHQTPRHGRSVRQIAISFLSFIGLCTLMYVTVDISTWLTLALALQPAVAAEALIIVQRSPLAGLRHYEAGAVWRDMSAGDRLELVREPENPYDANAVRVEWRGRKLGYLPRRDNAAVARQHVVDGSKPAARMASSATAVELGSSAPNDCHAPFAF